MKVKEVMTKQPTVVSPDDTIVDAARAMRARGGGMLPVVEDEISMRLVGVITDRDIAIRCVAAGHSSRCRVQVHMTHIPLHTVHASENAAVAARIMRTAHVRRLPVVDDDNSVVGVVSQADLATEARAHEAALTDDVLAAIAVPAASV